MRAMLLLLATALQGAAPAEVDPDHAFRTDFSNVHLPWYRLRPGQFPPAGSEHVVAGVLLEADFLHRTGQFRRVEDGALVDFTMPPSGTVLYLNAEADLRDVPPGTLLHFSMYQDERGDFTRVATIRDEFTRLARAGRAVRLEAVDAGAGKLVVSAWSPGGGGDSGRRELRVDGHARLWKGDRAVNLPDLAEGDVLLVNLSGEGRCAEVWAGAEAQRIATEGQRARHRAFLRVRGLAGWIDRVEGKALTVTLFGDPAGLRDFLKDEGIDPARSVAERRSVHAVVANDELRTYNPPVDGKRGPVIGFEAVPDGGHGCGGVRWVIEPDLLLEGFRKGQVVRLFAHPSWPINDMPFGECLYSEAPGAKPDRVDPNLYPYRTDSGNDHLPWYRPKPGEFPPVHSDHRVVGELLRVDDRGRSGRFRADGTGDEVDFTLPPYGSVLYLGAEADLRDVPTGTRCRFALHPDDRGAFTRAAVISDEFTELAADALTYRLDEARLDEGVLFLAKRHAPVKDDKDATIQPPDFGRGVFAVDDRTRVWKGDGRATLRDLAAGDALLVNTTGRTTTGRGTCTDLWAGAEAQKRATDRQRAGYDAGARRRGLPAWVERIEGTTLTVTFFAGSRRDFPARLGGDPDGGATVQALLADDELVPTGAPPIRLTYSYHEPEGATAGTYGCSGVRWRLHANTLPDGVRPGRVLRILKDGWPIEADPKAGPAPR